MDKQPNILLLFTDEMRFDAMGCAGNPHIHTPNLDRLAGQGVNLKRAYTPAPVCVAARYSLLYGQQCSVHGRFRNNVPDPEPLLYSLPQLLGRAGYYTEAIGKMHFSPLRRHHGFDRRVVQEETCHVHHRQDDDYLMDLKARGLGHICEPHGVRPVLCWQPQVSLLPEEHHPTTWIADRTIDCLRANSGRPFFCWSSFIAPHPPFAAPKRFHDLYSDVDLPFPADRERDAASLPARMRYSVAKGGMKDVADAHLRRVLAAYYACVTHVDHEVGRILNTLDELGLSDNTLVVFTADHGELLGDHNAWGKFSPYESSARIPFLMRLPGRVSAGATCTDLVTLHDIMPTALELSCADYPAEAPALAGRSLLGQGGARPSNPREEVVIELGKGPDRWLSLVRGNWKYNYYLRNGQKELFDLSRDPDETENRLSVSSAPEDLERAGRMHETLEKWEAQHGFPDSLDTQGHLRSFEEPYEERPDAAEEGYSDFGYWIGNLPADEAAAMDGKLETLRQATRFEDTFVLEDLPKFARWARHHGLTDHQLAEAPVAAIERRER